MMESNEDLQIKLARKFLKMKIIEDNLTFRDHEEEKLHISDIITRTVEAGESNSALVIGPRGSGKTTVSLYMPQYVNYLSIPRYLNAMYCL